MGYHDSSLPGCHNNPPPVAQKSRDGLYPLLLSLRISTPPRWRRLWWSRTTGGQCRDKSSGCHRAANNAAVAASACFVSASVHACLRVHHGAGRTSSRRMASKVCQGSHAGRATGHDGSILSASGDGRHRSRSFISIPSRPPKRPATTDQEVLHSSGTVFKGSRFDRFC